MAGIKLLHTLFTVRSLSGKFTSGDFGARSPLFRGILLPEHLEIGCVTLDGSFQNAKVRTPSPSLAQMSQIFS